MSIIRRRHSLIIALAAVVAAAACRDSPVAPDAPLTRDVAALFQTDSLYYALRAGDFVAGEIDVTFTNRTATTAYLINCNGATALQLERRVGNSWQFVWSPVLPACLSAPIVVPVGGTHRSRITIPSAPPATNGVRFDDPRTVPGEYRLVWTSLVSSHEDGPPFSDLLPLAARVSNAFRLSVQTQ